MSDWLMAIVPMGEGFFTDARALRLLPLPLAVGDPIPQPHLHTREETRDTY